MPELGLFPLRLVLVPGERVPLHIFEPRYRELIGDCLERDEEFGILLAEAGGLRSVGTRAAVVEVLERLDDGRLNIVVEGRERFRLVELTSGRSFRTGTVEPLADEDADAAPPEAVAGALRLLEQVAEAAGVDIELPPDGTPQLSFAIAAQVELEPADKQALLELRSEAARIDRLAGLLREAAERARRERAAASRAKTNGHLPHAPKLP